MISTGPSGNTYDKFNTSNPVAKRLMSGFLSSFTDLFGQVSGSIHTLLEVGCGEGYMLDFTHNLKSLSSCGIDVEMSVLLEASERCPGAQIAFADGHNLPYADKAFDFTMACEVLEHVHHPARVLAEIKRVTRQYAIFSVPREPTWRVLNVMRGKYWSDLGNTPGHIQHWSTAAFLQEVSAHFEIVTYRQPLPWTMVLCRVRDE